MQTSEDVLILWAEAVYGKVLKVLFIIEKIIHYSSCFRRPQRIDTTIADDPNTICPSDATSIRPF